MCSFLYKLKIKESSCQHYSAVICFDCLSNILVLLSVLLSVFVQIYLLTNFYIVNCNYIHFKPEDNIKEKHQLSFVIFGTPKSFINFINKQAHSSLCASLVLIKILCISAIETWTATVMINIITSIIFSKILLSKKQYHIGNI